MKERLDVLLVKRNLAASREKAKAIIMSGIVYVDGQKEDKAGSTYTQPDIITAFAFSLETASPLFTRRTSNLSFAISFSSIYLYKMITLCLPHLLRQFLLLF